MCAVPSACRPIFPDRFGLAIRARIQCSRSDNFGQGQIIMANFSPQNPWLVLSLTLTTVRAKKKRKKKSFTHARKQKAVIFQLNIRDRINGRDIETEAAMVPTSQPPPPSAAAAQDCKKRSSSIESRDTVFFSGGCNAFDGGKVQRTLKEGRQCLDRTKASPHWW